MNITMLILSCDKFSDLWEGHIKLLRQNWPDRDFQACIVTDAAADKTFDDVKIISAGAEKEWSERLAYALNCVDTDYFFITLDDYYLVNRVSNGSINELIEVMDKEHLDYVRLYKRPKRGTLEQLGSYEGIYRVDLGMTYTVNLYAGIWRRDFIKSITDKPVNAWKYEVNLTRRAKEYGALCCVSRRNEYRILDVVRKGKILHKAARYFKAHPGIYTGNRELQSWSYEIRLNVKTWIGRIMPPCMNNLIRNTARKFGVHFYRDEVD